MLAWGMIGYIAGMLKSFETESNITHGIWSCGRGFVFVHYGHLDGIVVQQGNGLGVIPFGTYHSNSLYGFLCRFWNSFLGIACKTIWGKAGTD